MFKDSETRLAKIKGIPIGLQKLKLDELLENAL